MSVELSPQRMSIIHREVIGELFGVSDNEIPAHEQRASRVKRLHTEALSRLKQLYVLPNPSYDDFRKTFEIFQKLDSAAQDYRSDALSMRFDAYASGVNRLIPNRVANSRFVRPFLVNSQGAANRNSEEVSRLFYEATVREIRRWFNLSETATVTVPLKHLQRFYQPIVDAVSFSQLHKYTPGIIDFLERTLNVSREGNTDAARLYYRWTSATLLADDSVGLDKRIEILSKSLSVPWRKNVLSNDLFYINAVRIGSFGVLAALDTEDQRSQKGRSLVSRVIRGAAHYSGMLFDTSELADKLLKMYVDPESASEMMLETPVGQRRKMLRRLKKNTGPIALFDQLREENVGARSYMSFFEHSSGRVPHAGITKYDFVQRLVQGKSQKGAAAWIVSNPGFWEPDGLEMRLKVAESPRFPEQRLELMSEWASYKGVQQLIAETHLGYRKLLPLLLRLKKLPQALLASVTPDNYSSVLAEFNGQPSKNGSAAVHSPDAWIDSLYPGNAALLSNLHSAYARLSSVNAAGRLPALNDYVVDNFPEGEQENILSQYASNILRMPEKLAAAIFGDSSIFRDDLIDSFSAFLLNPSAVSELIKDYSEGKNAYALLIERLRAASGSAGYDTLDSAVEAGDDVISRVPVRLAVFGQISPDIQQFVEARLNDPAIEIVYIDDARGSTLPQTTLPTIVYTHGLSHSSTAYGKLRQGNSIVTSSDGGRTGLVRDIRHIAFKIRERQPAE